MEQRMSPSPLPLPSDEGGGLATLRVQQPAYVALGLIVAGVAFTLSWVGLLAYWAISLTMHLVMAA